MDILSKSERSRRMASIRQKDTKPELLVRKLLHGAGHRYRLHRRDLPGTPDIVFPGRKLAIFVHGCFWHGHDCRAGRAPSSNQVYWSAKIEANRRRDQDVMMRLEAIGWRGVAVWACELRNRPSLLARLADLLKGA